MATLTAGWLLGLVLGMRHALEPDHLAAVSTLVSEVRGTRRAACLGIAWGIGHTAAIVGLGGMLLLARGAVPDRSNDLLELAVAGMLLTLGARAIARALRDGAAGRSGRHSHGDTPHEHAGPAAHVHLGSWTLARFPLVIGSVHGLAGSGAVAALALAQMPTPGAGVVYLGLFGAGSIAGMALLSALASWSFERVPASRLAQNALSGAAGLLSATVGILHGWPHACHLLAP